MLEKNWRPEKIRFFDLNCEEPDSVVTIHRFSYYRNVYVFINQLKNVALLQLMEKTHTILSQLLREKALI